MIKSSNKMPRPEQLSKEDMAGFEEDGDEDDLPLPILKRKNVRKLSLLPQSIFHFCFLNFWHFFEVWRNSFDVLRFIFERGLFSRKVKSYVRTVYECIYYRS